MSLHQKGFLPYLVVVFLNAFVDLGHKIVIQNTIFKNYDGQEQVVLTAVVNGLILLPFILLFSPAGFLSDRFAKHRIMRHSALFAVAATLAITVAYYQGWFWAAFGLTFALAVQSAIYSPAKYGYIKELVGSENLAAANGAVQAVTIVGILLGTFVFSILFEGLLAGGIASGQDETVAAVAPIGWVLVALAALEWFTTALLPARVSGAEREPFRVAPYLQGQYLKRNLSVIGHNPAIWLSIIGLATFWAISQVMLAAFPAFAKETLGIDNTVIIQGILACSGIGIVIGSVLAGRVSRNYIETGLIPVGALGIAIGIAVLPGLDSAVTMSAVFLLVGITGGLFIVPLNALIQFHARADQLGTVLAGNNWVQNVAMLGALLLTVVFATAGIDSVGLFYILTAAAVIGTGYTVRKLPHSLARILATALLKRRYQLEVLGFENIPQSGPTLLLGNHISWIDWALVQIACPRPIRFVMLRRIYETWYLKPFLKAFGVVPIAAGQSEESLATVRGLLQSGECVCLFPEGAISRNGQLGKFHTGYERAVAGVEEGVIVPFYLCGLWGSSLSRAEEGLRRARVPLRRRDLIVAFGAPLALSTGAKQLKQKVVELSLTAWDAYTQKLDPVPLAWLRAAGRDPGATGCIEGRSRMSNHQLVTDVACLAHALGRQPGSDRIGVLLPAGSATIVTSLAILLQGKVLVPLNYTAGSGQVRATVETAGLSRVITSRRFAGELAAQGVHPESMTGAAELTWFEDLEKLVPRWRRLLTGLQARLLPPSWFYRLHGTCRDIDEPAAIMFTRGGERGSKGVLLSHRNIMANCRQISDVLNTDIDDVMLCCLPPFHSLGLTVTTMMPLVEGIPVTCHADPRDAVGVARTIARSRATLLVTTPSFLQCYASAEHVHPLMLDSLRLVVSGADHLSDEVRRQFELRFGKRIYEGYGTTETTPVASVNVPDAMDMKDWKVQQGNVPGTVGMPLPGTSFRIVDPVTLEEKPLGEDGLVLISGNQLMLGYLGDEEGTGRVISERGGVRWFHSGDRGHLTEEGFLVLRGRQTAAAH
jgi:acyl-[acyl-carrier-protein]-phospholipid O-acyltransferase / long-chain-fatty-acid--[acyl-carrier-protein] ligase